MAVPFLNSITLNKNEVQDFKVYNIGTGNPTLSSGGDIGYFWTDTTGSASARVLKWWDGSNVRTVLDSSSTTVIAADLSGGAAGSLPYQQGASDTTFLGIGTAGQVLKVNSGATAPEWTAQSNLSVGTATFLAGGTAGDIPVQSAAGTTGFLNIGANGRILTSNGTTPVWSATIPSSAVSGLAASATTDTTNASNISSGTLSLGRLSLANGQFYVGDASNNPAATAKSSIPLSGFGAAGADVAMGGYKLTGLGAPTASTDAATMGYVDSVAQGLDVKASCKAATVSNINLASPGATIDTVSLSVDNRVLVKDQSLPAENGIYLWKGAAVAMVRSPDADTWDELVGAFTFVEEGTTANADSGWVCTVNAGGTLGTTAVTWTKFSQAGSYTAGNGMVLSGGVFHFAQSSAYTAGQIPFASSTSAIGFSSNLFWDNSNSRLGIGTASPGTKVDIIGGAIRINNSSLGSAANDGILLDNYAAASPNNYLPAINWNTGTLTWATIDGLRAGGGGYGGTIRVNTMDSSGVNTERLRIASDGVCTWSNVGGVAGTAMTLNANGLGIGGGPVAPDGASRTFQIGSSTVIQTPVGEQTSFSNNTYYDGTSWKRIVANRFCNSIRFNGLGNTGDITFSCAGTGAANSVLTNWDTSDVKMVLNYLGNLGIGTTTPAYTLDVNGTARIGTVATAGRSALLFSSGASNFTIEQTNNGSGSHVFLFKLPGWTNDAFVWNRGSTQLATLNGDGNLGLGVTPSAYGSTYKTLQIGSGANYAVVAGASNGDGGPDSYGAAVYGNNSYDFPNNKAVGTGASSIYLQSGGRHLFYSAQSVNAGQAQSFGSAKMTLDASGNLLVGTTSSLRNTAHSFKATGSSNAYWSAAFQHTGTTSSPRLLSWDIPNSNDGGAYFVYATNSGGNCLNILGNGRIEASAGSTSGVAYGKVGDENTGLYFPAADTLALAVGGSDAVYINSGGNVSIGDSVNGSRLRIVGTNTADGPSAKFLLSLYNSAAQTSGVGSGIGFGTNVGTFNATICTVEGIKENGTSDNYASALKFTTRVNGGDMTERLRIKSTGQLNFTGLAADPTGAAGDLYYSTSNVLKLHNGTAWQQVGRKYTTALSSTGTSFTVTHNLGTRDVTVQVRKSGSTYDVVYTDIQMTTTDTVTVIFASSVTGSDYTVTVIG